MIPKNRINQGVKCMNYPKTSIELTDKTFARNIERYPLLVVVCLPTMEYSFGNPLPIINTMAKECQGKAVFGLLNIQKNKKTALYYDVNTTPVVMIFKEGRLVGYLKNDVTRKDIEERIGLYI
jgi:thioredoxin-like negative regulator of GroEL